MADYCMTFIYIEGEKETLHRVADKINLEGGLKSDVFAPMRFEAEDYDFNHCEDARVFDNESRVSNASSSTDTVAFSIFASKSAIFLPKS